MTVIVTLSFAAATKSLNIMPFLRNTATPVTNGKKRNDFIIGLEYMKMGAFVLLFAIPFIIAAVINLGIGISDKAFEIYEKVRRELMKR